MNTAIVPGSLSQIAKRDGASLAEAFVNAEAVILCDTSGSMHTKDSRGGRSRYEVALEELAQLQNANPGKLAVIAFSDTTVFVPTGQPPLLSGGTDLAGALRFAKMADTGDMKFIVISDGQPDDEQAALQAAAQFKGRIDCVFVGREDDQPARAFLERLAKRSGGQAVLADKAQQLAAQTQRLLLA